jgi:hypothetical protein
MNYNSITINIGLSSSLIFTPGISPIASSAGIKKAILFPLI